MKILLLTDKMDLGGAETHVLSLAEALGRAGHSVTVASSGGHLAKRLKQSGVRHLYLPLHSKSPSDLLRTYLSLCRITKKESFDIIHSHARLPSLLVSSVAKRRGIPLICTAHAKFSLGLWRKALSRWGDSTIAVSQDLKQYLVEGYDLSPENITVIPNGIDLREYSSPPLPTENLRIAFLSRLDDDCSLGAELLCRIAPRLTSRFGRLRIIIGGGGSELQRISKLADGINSRLGFECITVWGHVRNVPSFLRSADIFVGVSRAAIEAALCSLPVILCGNEGFMGELTAENVDMAATNNFCGRDYPRPDEDRLFSSLCSVISMDKEAISEKTKKLSLILRERFDVDKTAKDTVDIYKKAHLPCKRSDVLLCGYYGFGNMGDDVLLRSALCRAKKEFPSLTVGALTNSPTRDRARFGIPCHSRHFPIALMSCKHLIFGGGTLLQENTSLRSLCYYSFLLLAAKKLGARVYLWGNGIGRPRSPLGAYLLRASLNACDYIGLRDMQSLKIARSLCQNPSVFLENDLAVGSAACAQSRAKYLLFRLFGSENYPPFIIVAPRKDKCLGKLRKALKKTRAKGYRMVFVPMYPKADRKITLSLCKEFCGLLLEGICYSDLVAISTYSKAVYSMRLHALIAAKEAGVPFHSFSSDEKIKGYLASHIK